MRKTAFFLAVSLVWIAAGIAHATTATAPKITTQPKDATVVVGKAATYTVVASGTAPLSYQWYKNGEAVSGATKASYTTAVTTTADSYTYGVYYYVTVTNTAGTVTSNSVGLTVVAPPTISQQPTSITITAPAIATFWVEADGTSPLKYQWLKNGTAISGATSDSYTLQETATTDTGAKFTCKVTNTAGSVTSKAAVLTIKSTTAGTYPIVGTWAGTATVTSASDASTYKSTVTASFAQNAYSLNATIAFTDENSETNYGSGIAALNTLNMFTSFDADGATASIAGVFSTDKLTFTGIATGPEGASGNGTFTISSDKKTLTGTATDSLGDSFSFTLKRK